MKQAKEYKDHKGNSFCSLEEMLSFWKIERHVYLKRIRIGWTQEKALTTPVASFRKPQKDHLGNEFSSQKEMLDYWGMDRNNFQKRMRSGWSLEDALTKEIQNTGNKPCTDHLGNRYQSISDMCSAYNKTIDVFSARMSHGWSLKKALTKDVHINAKSCIDFHGKSYQSIREMCENHGISYTVYARRRKSGLTKKEALSSPANRSFGEEQIICILDKMSKKEGLTYVHDKTMKTVFSELGMDEQYDEFIDLYYTRMKQNGMIPSSVCRETIERFRFDFALIKDKKLFAFIEYDGIQHFTFVFAFFKTMDEFLERKEMDEMKNRFSETAGIPLLRIRYDQKNIMDKMISDLVRNPELYIKKHNTILSEKEYREFPEESVRIPDGKNCVA